jgi:hypothetical protein
MRYTPTINCSNKKQREQASRGNLLSLLLCLHRLRRKRRSRDSAVTEPNFSPKRKLAVCLARKRLPHWRSNLLRESQVCEC